MPLALVTTLDEGTTLKAPSAVCCVGGDGQGRVALVEAEDGVAEADEMPLARLAASRSIALFAGGCRQVSTVQGGYGGVPVDLCYWGAAADDRPRRPLNSKPAMTPLAYTKIL